MESGFDEKRPALFLWEGVTPYLDRAAVEDTLRKISGSTRGTIVAFDYLTTEVLESRSLSLRAVRASLGADGEPLKFAIDSTRVSALLEACGLSLVEQRTVGKETARRRAWGGCAVAVVK